MKTLKEVCDIVGLKRRAIQEYERTGVASTPKTTNKYGHLLYDEEAIYRLWQIRFYRELGYDKREMKHIFDDSNYDKRKVIKSQISELEKKKQELEQLIVVAKNMAELGISHEDIRFGMPCYEEMSYDLMNNMLYEMFNRSQFFEDGFVDIVVAQDENVFNTSIELLIECNNEGEDIGSVKVQDIVFNIHNIT